MTGLTVFILVLTTFGCFFFYILNVKMQVLKALACLWGLTLLT